MKVGCAKDPQVFYRVTVMEWGQLRYSTHVMSVMSVECRVATYKQFFTCTFDYQITCIYIANYPMVSYLLTVKRSSAVSLSVAPTLWES